MLPPKARQNPYEVAAETSRVSVSEIRLVRWPNEISRLPAPKLADIRIYPHKKELNPSYSPASDKRAGRSRQTA